MQPVSTTLLNAVLQDEDAREVTLRRIVTERLAQCPPPVFDDQIVASYFFAFRTLTLEQAAGEISYHATSGTHSIPPGSLLEKCTGRAVGIDAFEAGNRIGIVHMAYPLKMLLQPDGHLTSCDILHTAAGAIIFDVYENQDARLLALQIPEQILRHISGTRSWTSRCSSPGGI